MILLILHSNTLHLKYLYLVTLGISSIIKIVTLTYHMHNKYLVYIYDRLTENTTGFK